jgi:hypothetical protein
MIGAVEDDVIIRDNICRIFRRQVFAVCLVIDVWVETFKVVDGAVYLPQSNSRAAVKDLPVKV